MVYIFIIFSSKHQLKEKDIIGGVLHGISASLSLFIGIPMLIVT